MTVDATVVVRAYREGTDWQTQPMWTRRAKLGECEVSLWFGFPMVPAPIVIDSRTTNSIGVAHLSYDLLTYSGVGQVWVKHLASGAIVRTTFQVEGGTYVEGTLSALEVLDYGSMMPGTFNQARLSAGLSTRLRIGRRR